MQVISKISKKHYIIYSLLAISILNLIIINHTYADDLDYSVTVQPSLNVTTSASDIVLRLNPATNPFASENLTVSVGTNNQTGYQLIVSTPNDTTNLVEENDSNLYIETLSSEVSESNFTANRWGYKLNSSSTNYAPFVSGTLVNSSDTATASVSSTLTFGAKADYNTKAGTYNLALNFQATANPLVTYIQDYDKATCATEATDDSVTVLDSRDDNEYQVRYINNNCWMVQNLRYVGDTGSTSTSMIMKSATSNISTDQNLTIGDLTLGNDYNNARIHVATPGQVPSGASYTATDMGAWYNYAAASAGYVTSNKNSTVESTESVCPKNWRLPTNSEISGITSYQSAFFNGGSAVTGGRYNAGGVDNTGNGCWWSSTPSSGSSNTRYCLSYNGSSLNASYDFRYYGLYVRCIRSS